MYLCWSVNLRRLPPPPPRVECRPLKRNHFMAHYFTKLITTVCVRAREVPNTRKQTTPVIACYRLFDYLFIVIMCPQATSILPRLRPRLRPRSAGGSLLTELLTTTPFSISNHHQNHHQDQRGCNEREPSLIRLKIASTNWHRYKSEGD